jgi:hypothetical protein
MGDLRGDNMLSEALSALAAAGGVALVQSAATDAWATARTNFARLLGGRSADRVTVIDTRLEETRAHLQRLAGPPLELARHEQATMWTARLRDLLEEDPDAAPRLQDIIEQLAAASGLRVVAGDHGLAVGGDQVNFASSGGIAAGVVQGDVSSVAPPPRPGSAQA